MGEKGWLAADNARGCSGWVVGVPLALIPPRFGHRQKSFCGHCEAVGKPVNIDGKDVKTAEAISEIATGGDNYQTKHLSTCAKLIKHT